MSLVIKSGASSNTAVVNSNGGLLTAFDSTVPLPAGTNLLGSITVSNFPAFSFIEYGSPPVSAQNVYVVNPSSGSVSVSGIVEISANATANTVLNPIAVQATQGQLSSSSAASWTSATAQNTALVVSTGTMSAVNVEIQQGGTITGGALTFEYSVDGTNYIAYQANQIVNSNVLSNLPGAGLANPLVLASEGSYTGGLVLPNYGYTSIRVRLSTVLTGTAPTITLSYAGANYGLRGIYGAGTLGAAPVGGPVYVGSSDANGSLRQLTCISLYGEGGSGYQLQTVGYLYGGSTYERPRSATIGNNVASTGLAASAAYGQYNTSAPTVSAGDYTALQTDASGNLKTIANSPIGRSSVGTASVQCTGPQVTLIAGAASQHRDILTLILTNESSLATVVTLSDGTVSYKFAVAANGGGVFELNPLLPATNLNTAWTVSNSEAGSPPTSATIDCVAIYVANS